MNDRRKKAEALIYKFFDAIDTTNGYVVKNTKYTPWNFLFKNLFEQFRFVLMILLYLQSTNELLLLINCLSSSTFQFDYSLLQLIKTISVNNPITTWLPLIFIFAVSAIRELSDDLKRAKSDKVLIDFTFLKIESK